MTAAMRERASFVRPEKGKLHIYLLMGQSNMVGRDTAGLESQTLDDRVGFLDVSNKWQVAREPMHLGGAPGWGSQGDSLAPRRIGLFKAGASRSRSPVSAMPTRMA